jgi:hypothetical protein
LEDSKMLNLNKVNITERCTLLDQTRSGNGHPKICRRIPGSSGMLLLREPVYCARDVYLFFEKELQLVKDYYLSPSNSRFTPLTKNVNVIITSIGPWEVRFPSECLRRFNKTAQEWNDLSIDMIESFQQHTNITILWKTSGFIQGKSDGYNSQLRRMINNRVMDRIDSLRVNDTGVRADDVFTYLNWGAAVEPRSFEMERNEGDHVAHYGLESRLVMFQMMTNYLRDLGFFAQQNRLSAPLPL